MPRRHHGFERLELRLFAEREPTNAEIAAHDTTPLKILAKAIQHAINRPELRGRLYPSRWGKISLHIVDPGIAIWTGNGGYAKLKRGGKR